MRACFSSIRSGIQLRTPYRDLSEPIEMTIQDDDLEAPVAGTVSDGLFILCF